MLFDTGSYKGAVNEGWVSPLIAGKGDFPETTEPAAETPTDISDAWPKSCKMYTIKNVVLVWLQPIIFCYHLLL